MSVTAVVEIGGKQLRRTLAADNYVRRFKITSDDREDDADLIKTEAVAAGLPDIGDAYSLSVTNALANDLDIRQTPAEPTVWEATVTYDNSTSGAQHNPDPEDDDTIYEWGEQVIIVPIDQTTDAPPENIDNSAGDKFNPPLTQEEALLTLRITRNKNSFNPNTAAAFRNTINDAVETLNVPDCTSLAAGAGTLYIASYTAINGERDGDKFWTETILLVYRPDGWARDVLDAGLRRLDGGGDLVPIYVQGQKATEPIPLDGAGQPKSASGDFTILTFDVREEADFSTLSLAP